MKKITTSKKNRFSKYQSYTIDDVAFICDKTRKTVERWIADGLAPYNPGSKPYFFMGDAVADYLHNKIKTRKWNMSGGSYPCFKCKKGVKAKEKNIRAVGNIRHSLCKKCGSHICKTIGKANVQIRSP
ncbi:MAG: hypothetical protein WC819_04160 [Parcubacteria group bacterium]|jgi:hypothetical protein